jgi:hypothetical protein
VQGCATPLNADPLDGEAEVVVPQHPLDELIERLRERYDRFGAEVPVVKRFVDHLDSLASFHEEDFESYPMPADPVVFPPSLPIAFAICKPECGVREFIVEGGTQECQKCGSLLFRVATTTYRLE